MATDKRGPAPHECDGVLDYSAHHHYIVVFPHYHDGYTALNPTAGKRGLHGVSGHRVPCALQRSLLFVRTVSFVG